MIAAPGIYDGIDEVRYHADDDLAPKLGRSLSASGAKTLLYSPERFAWEREHGRPAKDAYDMGSLVHAVVLRSHDSRIRVVAAGDWRTKAAQQAKADAHAAGLIPVLAKDVRLAIHIARVVRAHPLAGAVLRDGRPEVSIYWRDEATGITCRGRIDYVHPKALVDLKTVASYGLAEPERFGRQAANLNYPLAAAHYVDGWHALTGDLLPFVTVTVELDPPHFITVSQYHPDDLNAGRKRMAAAKAEFAERESSGVWAEPPEIVTLPVPGWYAATA